MFLVTLHDSSQASIAHFDQQPDRNRRPLRPARHYRQQSITRLANIRPDFGIYPPARNCPALAAAFLQSQRSQVCFSTSQRVPSRPISPTRDRLSQSKPVLTSPSPLFHQPLRCRAAQLKRNAATLRLSRSNHLIKPSVRSSSVTIERGEQKWLLGIQLFRQHTRLSYFLHLQRSKTPYLRLRSAI